MSEQDSLARQRAIDPKYSFLVQAPAGSGKTELLTQRFLALLGQVEQYPEEILAVTFTKKAAAQMRHRILQALRDAQGDPPKAEHQQQSYQLAKYALKRNEALSWGVLENPNRLRIQTIDALAARLVQQMPMLSQFGICPDLIEDPVPLYQKAIQSFIQSCEPHSVEMAHLNRLLFHLDNRPDILAQIFEEWLSQRDQWLDHIVPISKSPEAFLEILHQNVEQLRRETYTQAHQAFNGALKSQLWPLARFCAHNLLQEGDASPIGSLAQVPDTSNEDRQWEGWCALLLTQQGQWRKSFTKHQGFIAPSAVKSGPLRVQCKENKAAMQALSKELVHYPHLLKCLNAIRDLPPKQAYIDPKLLQAVATLLPILVAHLHLVFKEKGKIDFIEMSMGALRALGNTDGPSDLMLRLDYQIRHLLIDEFQDTSFVQLKIFEHLVEGWSPNDGRSVFLVGDPMQSIYLFRKAEVGNFLKVKEQGLNGVPLIPLSLRTNFRSHPDLIHWVNTHLSGAFPKEDDVSLGAIHFHHAKAHCVTPKEMQGEVKWHVSDPQTPLSEEALIYQIIRSRQEQNPLQSIAVLVRSRHHIYALLKFLKKKNVPFEAVEIERPEHSQCLLDLLSLTKAMRDLNDRLAWMSVLRSPLCGLALSDLHALVQFDKTQSPLALLRTPQALLQLSKEGQMLIQQFMVCIEHWLLHYHRLAYGQWIQRLWEALGGQALIRPTDQPLYHFYFKCLADYETSGKLLDYSAFEQHIKKAYLSFEHGKKGAQTPVLPIQIMTIHKAKGLEFDTVILPGLHKYTSQQAALFLNGWEKLTLKGMALLLGIKSDAITPKYTLFDYIQKQLNQKNEYERLRLLYVALTRAKQYLHLMCKIDSKEGEVKPPSRLSFLHYLWPSFQEDAVQTILPTQKVSDKEEAKWKSPPMYQITQRPPIQPLLNEWGPREVTDLNRPQHTASWQSTVGTFIHQLFALMGTSHKDSVVNIAKQNPKAWAFALTRLNVPKAQLPFAIETAQRAVCHLATDPVGQWILSDQHQQIKNEWALTEHKGTLKIVHVIDRSFIEKGQKLWIIDYKILMHQSLDLDWQQIWQSHQPQLKRYVNVAHTLYSGPIAWGLYFPLQKKWLDHSMNHFNAP